MIITKRQYEKYLKEVEDGYINLSKHPEDENLVILNYNNKTIYARRWNHETITARGLIIDTELLDGGLGAIIAKPFDKFPNYGTNEIEGYEDDIDWGEIDAITTKMDGSLGISYIRNGEVHFATKGSFTSEQAIKAKEIWDKKYQSRFESLGDLNLTMLVEIIYPENRILVDYGDKEDLVLIGVSYAGEDLPYEALTYYGNFLGMEVAMNHQLTLDEMLKHKSEMSANNEGYVIRFNNGKRLKIKGDEYLRVAKIKNGLSLKSKYIAWADGSLQDLILQLPEEFREEIEEFEVKADKIYECTLQYLEYLYGKIYTEDRREFAKKVNKYVESVDRKFMFYKYDGGDASKLVKPHIAKNYSFYESISGDINDLFKKQ